MPLVPDGPIRRFYERLHDLHAAAGRPSMRDLQRATRGQLRPNGINPTTIHDAFAAPRLARWEVVREIVTKLGGDPDEFAGLWRDARQAVVLAADPTGVGRAADADTPGRGVGPPRELPPDVSSFTGRAEQLKRLDEWLPDGATAVVIAAVTGSPGVGKTALAVHWAHRVQHRFPDGQLYVNLRGYAPGRPVRPVQALAQLLHSLGVPSGEVPHDEDAATARYRSALADRRALIVLDNAVSPAQVRPLVPASPGCLLLVTSRDRLSGLVARDGARRLGLDVLTADEAYLLLERILGVQRVTAEPDAATAMARACAYLPLALRLAAAGLIDQPRRSIARHSSGLTGGSLAALEADDDEQTGVRAAFDQSYRALTPDRQRLFRFSGLAPGPDLTAGAAAALLGVAEDEAARLLERLAATHLLGQYRPDRYAGHDLLREYAADRARAEDCVADRQAALGRLFDWYLRGADAAATLVYPHRLRLPMPASGPDTDDQGTVRGPVFADRTDALAWLDDERANLVATISYTADHGPQRTAWLLADTLRSYFWLRMHIVDLVYATDAALRAAESGGDVPAQAITLLSLSNIQHRQRRYQPAVALATRALLLAERAPWPQAQAAALGVLATAHRDAGDLDEAARAYDRALALYRAEGARSGEALTLNHLGRTYWYLGRLADAHDCAARAVDIYRLAGAGQGEAFALDTLGEICLADGRVEEAVTHLERALTLARELGDRGAEAYTLRDLAEAHRDRGELRHSLDLARSAVALAGEGGDVRIRADALNTLATVHHLLGQSDHARLHHEEALELVNAAGDPYPQIQALLGLAAVCDRLGRSDQALDHARRAFDAAHRGGFRLLEDRARELLGS